MLPVQVLSIQVLSVQVLTVHKSGYQKSLYPNIMYVSFPEQCFLYQSFVYTRSRYLLSLSLPEVVEHSAPVLSLTNLSVRGISETKIVELWVSGSRLTLPMLSMSDLTLPELISIQKINLLFGVLEIIFTINLHRSLNEKFGIGINILKVAVTACG